MCWYIQSNKIALDKWLKFTNSHYQINEMLSRNDKFQKIYKYKRFVPKKTIALLTAHGLRFGVWKSNVIKKNWQNFRKNAIHCIQMSDLRWFHVRNINYQGSVKRTRHFHLEYSFSIRFFYRHVKPFRITD